MGLPERYAEDTKTGEVIIYSRWKETRGANKAFEENFPLKELNNPGMTVYHAICERVTAEKEIRIHIVFAMSLMNLLISR